jgi:hypothetical protein
VTGGDGATLCDGDEAAGGVVDPDDDPDGDEAAGGVVDPDDDPDGDEAAGGVATARCCVPARACAGSAPLCTRPARNAAMTAKTVTVPAMRRRQEGGRRRVGGTSVMRSTVRAVAVRSLRRLLRSSHMGR